MSDAQQEHALAIGHLAPTLAALRIELCPIHMSEECFWKIYFVLLHPRLSKHDAELLSTPQVNFLSTRYIKHCILYRPRIQAILEESSEVLYVAVVLIIISENYLIKRYLLLTGSLT